MIYFIGTFGFFCGFILGQLLLLRILKSYSNDDLIEDKSLHWKYGLINWILAFSTAASAVWLYIEYTK